MHWKHLLPTLIPFIVVSIAFIMFFARAIEVREERPQLLRNTISFFVPFLLAPSLSVYGLILLPLFLLAAIIELCIPSRRFKGMVFWLGLGGTTGIIGIWLYIFLMNTLLE